MTIHKHNTSSTRLSRLATLSRCASLASFDSLTNLSNQPASDATTRTQSTTSIASMISSLATTPDYSPTLIDTEVGHLLSVDDLELTGGEVIDDDKDEEGLMDDLDYDSDRDSLYDEFFTLPQASRLESRLPSKNESRSNSREAESRSGSHVSLNSVGSYLQMGKNLDELMCGYVLPESEGRYDPDKFDFHEKWFVCLIGLPACGKSTVVKELRNFAELHTASETNPGIRVKSFNAGDVRRKHEMVAKKKMNFDLSDAGTKKARELYALEALRQLTDSLVKDKVDIGVLDATNTTEARREAVFKQVNKVSQQSGVKINTLILEVKCANKSLRRYNIEQKSENGDYKGIKKDQAIRDFLKRIEKYEKIYERVTVGEINRLGARYFSLCNAGEIICYDCGLAHHDCKHHEQLTFSQAALNLVYDFVMSYRGMYAIPYLKDVEDFYVNGHYKPVTTAMLPPKVKDVVRPPLLKVMSSPRMSNLS